VSRLPDLDSNRDFVADASRLFEFFTRSTRLRIREQLSTDNYKDVEWLRDFPDSPAVRFPEPQEAEQTEYVLQVDKLPYNEPPVPDSALSGGLGHFDYRDPSQKPSFELPQPIDSDPDGHFDEVLTAEEEGHLTGLYEEWFSRWSSWAEGERPLKPVRDLYKSLHDIERELSIQPENWDLVLGVGLLTMRRSDGDSAEVKLIKRHVFTHQLRIALDYDTGTLEVTLSEGLNPFRIELDMIPPEVGPRRPDLDRMEEEFLNDVIHPLNLDGLDDLLGKLATAIRTPTATAHRDDVDPTEDADITDIIHLRSAPALILRERPKAPQIAFFEEIKLQLDELHDAGGPLPEGLTHLFDSDWEPRDDRSDSLLADPPNAELIEDESLLPLSANKQQLKIVQQLNQHAFVVVQGPPGTGKTHTIANLLGHLLANGQKVLITAEKDQALREIRDKLPAEIRDLCVSSVGRDDQDRHQLQESVRILQARKGDFEATREDDRRRLEDISTRIDEIIHRQAELNSRLAQEREWETIPHEVGDYNGVPGAIAAGLADDRERHEWFSDHYQAEGDPLPSAGKAAKYLDLHLDGNLNEVLRRFPESIPDDWHRLVGPDEFRELVGTFSRCRIRVDEVLDCENDPLFQPLRRLDRFHRATVAERAEEIAEMLERQDGLTGWLGEVQSDVLQGRTDQWSLLASKVEDHLRVAQLRLDDLGITQVRCEDARPIRFKECARDLSGYLVEGGSLNRRFRKPKPVKEAEEFLSAVRVNEVVPKSPEAIQYFLDWLDAIEHLKAADVLLQNNGQPSEGESLPSRRQRISGELVELRVTLDVRHELELFSSQLENLGLIRFVNFEDPESVRSLVKIAKAAECFEDLEEVDGRLQELQSVAAQDWNPLEALCAAVENQDVASYRDCYRQLTEIADAHDRAVQRTELSQRMELAAPGITSAISRDPGIDWRRRLASLPEAVNWCRSLAWLSETPRDLEEIHNELDGLRTELKLLRTDLISQMAWNKALSNLSNDLMTSLGAYVVAVGQFGKTGGKFAAARRREIQERLRDCRPAVAAWILPLHKVFSDMKPEPEMFDVVIIDEASQARTDANFLHYLARKVVVIGDDKQVAPAGVGLPIAPLRALVNTFLGGIPRNQRLIFNERDTSFFDHARMRNPVITLTEHFRCVPEIIEFSNREFYEPARISLDPVRMVGSDRLPPLHRTLVPDAYRRGQVNSVEAEAIVAQIVECVNDPAYSEVQADGSTRKKTIGVISLTGPGQAELINRLLDQQLDEREIHDREIRCGDATAFQGAERDVIFLSMVNAPSEQDGADQSLRPANNRALTGAANERRFNVAASRARDQMWLFHSLRSADIPNRDCLRRRLLEFFQSRPDDPDRVVPARVSEDIKVHPFDSIFEQRVFNRIVERNYLAHPQFGVHGKKIDIVIEGAVRKLAVECDGDHWHGPERYQADSERQRDLERYGWTFFRIRESEFNWDPVQAMSKLWPLLDELDILPIRFDEEDGASS
jgi:very-short-patch-repair endonuclease